MKESTGGALLMGLAAGIIIIFIIMVAFFISFGKAFKIKNDLINYIEQQEGINETNLNNYKAKYPSRKIEVCYTRIERESNFVGFTMNVSVYMEMDETILGSVFKVSIPIKGETKMIEKGVWYNELSKGVSHNIPGIAKCS